MRREGVKEQGKNKEDERGIGVNSFALTPYPTLYPVNIFLRRSHNLYWNRLSAVKRLNNGSQIPACKSAHVISSFNHFLLAFTACPIIHLDIGL